MKIFYNNYLPTKKFAAINLFGIVFARRDCFPLHKDMIRHEAIHTAQILEMLILPFYVWYVGEWLVRLIQYRSPLKAYYNISLEREAYDNDTTKGYLKQRRMYSWLQYLRQKKC